VKVARLMIFDDYEFTFPDSPGKILKSGSMFSGDVWKSVRSGS
jgi:hypothetical protein